VTKVTAQNRARAQTDDRTEMTIQSYLVYPEPGRTAELSAALAEIPGCEVLASENRDLLVLVTEAPDEIAQKHLDAQLEELEGAACLAMVGGWTE